MSYYDVSYINHVQWSLGVGVDEILDLKFYNMIKQTTGDKFDEFVALFFAETQSSLDGLGKAITDKDYEQITFISHALKSTTATMGAMLMHSLAKKINNCTFPQDFNACQAMYIRLVSSFEEAKKAISRNQLG